uniref:Uncharacterized protein n=1 Tax=Anguilla anguilla TaxID=7936 RepID=A0A0E9S1T0_ANGAN
MCFRSVLEELRADASRMVLKKLFSFKLLFCHF